MSYNVKTETDTLWYKGEPVIKYRLKTVSIFGYKNGIEKINGILEDETDGYLKKIKESYYPKAALVFDNQAKEETEKLPFLLDFEIRVEYETEDVVSVTVNRSEKTGGEGNELYKKAYTFNKESGKQLKLTDVYKDAASIYERVSEKIAAEIKNGEEGYLPDWKIRLEKALKKGNYYLKDGKPVLWFDQYELMSYSYGIKEFEA